MIWSTEDELRATLGLVRKQCEELDSGVDFSKEIKPGSPSAVAPGVEQDTWLHKDDEISVEPFLSPSYKRSPSLTRDRTMPEAEKKGNKDENATPSGAVDKDAFEESENNEVEIIEVRPPSKPTV